MLKWPAQEKRIRRKLASNVRNLREKKGFSVEEVAHLAVLHWRHWQKIEAGDVGVTLRTMAKLSVVLGVDACELLR